ncbi:uncharacterized protein EDB91DRAFT_403996 [Suillus paluster]|uniref:uncharacterized protein n=1 Tax=Suillus paluster TaxID=48578 RepID=UPI001B88370B|nr:uncharacterized protein EDB91DRAFT_403996 [Suillus paluster]KAG1753557.1 hypothetical protein EDB91DRAFT_403996 [Suillus paluster]
MPRISAPLTFLIISGILLLMVAGCCHWRRGTLLGTTSDTDPTVRLYGLGDGWGRRKFIFPAFWETFLSPPISTEKVGGAGQSEWPSIQPVSVSLIRPCRSRATCKSAVDVSESAAHADPFIVTLPLPNNSQSSSTQPSPPRRQFAFPRVHPYIFHLWPRRRSHAHHGSAPSEKPTEVETENCPEAVKIAVIICMPSPALRCWNNGEGPSCHPANPGDALREYQIGVTHVPWTR